MNNLLLGILSLIGTIAIYMLARKLNALYRNPFTLPVLIGTVVIILILLLLDIPYETYYIGAKWIDKLLGPAIVALAYPLYQHWKMLKDYMIPIITGVFVGGIVGVSSGLFLVKWANFDKYIIFSLAPKSVTTPIAMDIADEIGGVASLAAVFVMIAGIGGGVLGQFVLKWSRINHFLGKGIGLGSASHAIGISIAMENSELEGAASTIAMILSAIIVSLITHPLIWLIM